MDDRNDYIIRTRLTTVSDNACNGIEIKADSSTITFKYYFFEAPYDLEIRFKASLKYCFLILILISGFVEKSTCNFTV